MFTIAPCAVTSMQAEVIESRTVPRPVRAFLSFAMADMPLFETFKSLVERQHPDVELLDHAVKDNYEEDWKRACATKIDRSELLICLVGATTYRSKAVAWEINHGVSLGKRVVAVKLSADAVRVPEILARHAIRPRESITGIDLLLASAPAFELETNDHIE